jgi:hypothetical protein
MRLVCAWCEKDGKPALLALVEPIADERTTHGICPDHRAQLEEGLRAKRAALKAKVDELSKLIDQVDP